MSEHSLQEQVASLQQQLEAYRIRELEELRSQLADAKALAAHYRAEAERNVQIGHQIAREAEGERARLRERISVLEQSSATRSPRVVGQTAGG